MKEHEEESIQRLKNDIIMLKKLSVNHKKLNQRYAMNIAIYCLKRS